MKITDRLGLAVMIYSTCGEDEDTLENTKVTELAEGYYHVQYKENDPYDGMDFKVRVTLMPSSISENGHVTFKYTTSESVYGDDGEFTLSIY